MKPRNMPTPSLSNGHCSTTSFPTSDNTFGKWKEDLQSITADQALKQYSASLR